MLHISCNIGTRDLPDMYALSPQALGIHIRQITRAYVTTTYSIAGCMITHNIINLLIPKYLWYLGIKKVCEGLQATCDTSVTNHLQGHGHKLNESVMMNKLADISYVYS